jgi:hypothetical protein
VTLLERFGPPRRLTVDPEAAAGGEHARRSGRSWWALRYVDGTIVHEWDRDGGSPNGHADWSRLAMLGKLKGTQALRLYCPNGQMAELGGEGDQTGRLFQFKQAVRYLRLSGEAAEDLGQEVLAHVLGIITGYNGQCTLYAWEPLPEPSPPPGCPPMPQKPNYMNREQPLWALKEQDQRYRQQQAEWAAFMSGAAMRDWKRQCDAWNAMGRGRLVGPIEDSVYDLKYQQIGRLHADHLGLADGDGR